MTRHDGQQGARAIRYGFIGLGHLGGHLAGSLLRGGFAVTVHDLDREAADAASGPGRELGGQARRRRPRSAMPSSPACLRLPSPRTCCAATDGILDGLKPAATWIEMSTSTATRSPASPPWPTDKGISTLGSAGHRRRASRRGRRDHRPGRRRRRRSSSTHRPALRGHGRRDLPYGAAGQRLGDQGHHQHAGLHPPGGGGRGADAGQARRPRSRPRLRAPSRPAPATASSSRPRAS